MRVIDQGPAGEILVLPGEVYFITEDGDGIHLQEASGAVSVDGAGRVYVASPSYDAVFYGQVTESALEASMIGTDVRYEMTVGSEAEAVVTVGSEPHVEERD